MARIETANLNQKVYNAVIYFEANCEIGDIEAFTIIQNLKEIADIIEFYPDNIAENRKSAEIIREEGFKIKFVTGCDMERIKECFFTERTV